MRNEDISDPLGDRSTLNREPQAAARRSSNIRDHCTGDATL